MKPFTLPMTKRERRAGWIYLPIHVFVMPLLIMPIIQVALHLSGVEISVVYLNAFYYGFGLLYILFFMMNYMRENFVRKWNPGWGRTILISIGLYLLFNIIINLVLSNFTDNLINPNQEAVNDSVMMNTPAMFAVAVLMGPIVEEVLFRGIVFGTIREKRPVAAYVVSALVFAFYHLWQSAVIAGDWSVFIYAVQYLPIGVVLAWTYERTGSIWGSISLHMLINTLAVAASASGIAE